MVETIEQLTAAVQQGELDEALEKAAKERSNSKNTGHKRRKTEETIK